MRKQIHVNQHVIKRNRKNHTQDPVITIKTYKGNTYSNDVFIDGPSTVVYRPDMPLACGATVWIETKAPVWIDGQEKCI
jgi:hypothetical protein